MFYMQYITQSIFYALKCKCIFQKNSLIFFFVSAKITIISLDFKKSYFSILNHTNMYSVHIWMVSYVISYDFYIYFFYNIGMLKFLCCIKSKSFLFFFRKTNYSRNHELIRLWKYGLYNFPLSILHFEKLKYVWLEFFWVIKYYIWLTLNDIIIS